MNNLKEEMEKDRQKYLNTFKDSCKKHNVMYAISILSTFHASCTASFIEIMFRESLKGCETKEEYLDGLLATQRKSTLLIMKYTNKKEN